LKSINGARLEEPLAHQNATPQLRFFSLFSMKRKVKRYIVTSVASISMKMRSWGEKDL
jgi:hypothetical protein